MLHIHDLSAPLYIHYNIEYSAYIIYTILYTHYNIYYTCPFQHPPQSLHYTIHTHTLYYLPAPLNIHHNPASINFLSIHLLIRSHHIFFLLILDKGITPRLSLLVSDNCNGTNTTIYIKFTS